MKKLGKFEIIDKVGQGAMGVVYKARDPFIDRIVALKTLTTGLPENRGLLNRFYSEARSAGSLRHPNIVTVYELGHDGDIPFIAMQFLEGKSLDKIISAQLNLPLSQKVGFIVQVCRALDYAHKRTPAVIHRDIKPANVMLSPDGTVVVVDFGIAQLGESTSSQSSGFMMGTISYMSPQLFRGETADPCSDIWATGIMFYELLACRRPFKGETAAALMSSIVFEEHRSILEAAPGTPEEIRGIIDRMLAKQVDARYQSMEEVLADLEPIWKRLLQSDITIFLENSQRFYEEGDLLAAKSEIGLIQKWDPTSSQARILCNKINGELRRQQILPQLNVRLENAQKLLAEGRNEEAKCEAEAALKLDFNFPPALEVIRQAQAAMEKVCEIERAMYASRQLMAEGALTEAEIQLDKVLSLDPANVQARAQVKQIQDESSRRERNRMRDTLLQRARTFWTKLEYDECIGLLLSAEKEFPGDSEIIEFLDTARRDQTEQQRQLLLTEIRNQLSMQQFEAALKSLDMFLEEFPADVTALNLRIRTLQGRENQEREQRLTDGKSELRAMVKQRKYRDAMARGENLQREFQTDFELAELLLFAKAEQAQAEQRSRLEQFVQQIRQAIGKGHFPEAIETAEKALPEFPKNTEILSLLDRAKKEHAEKQKRALLKQRIREVERALERQQLTEAIDLARHTITTVGYDQRLADTLQGAEKERELRDRNKRRQEETLKSARIMLNEGRTAEVTILLSAAVEINLFSPDDHRIKDLVAEIDALKSVAASVADVPLPRPDSPIISDNPLSSTPASDLGKDYVCMPGGGSHIKRSNTSLQNGGSVGASPFPLSGQSAQLPPPSGSQTNILAPSPSTFSSKVIDSNEKQLEVSPLIEKHLATFIGPLAGIVLQRAASKAKDEEEFFTLLASTLTSQEDRQTFLSRRSELVLKASQNQQESEASKTAGEAQPAEVSSVVELNPASVGHAAELLAPFLGPISKILAERAAKRADSLQSLYLILGGHLKEGPERDQFLQKAALRDLTATSDTKDKRS